LASESWEVDGPSGDYLCVQSRRNAYPRRAFDSDRDKNEVVLSLTGENMSTPESRRLAEAIGGGNLIDRRVASVLYGLSDYLTLERKTVPDQVFSEIERLECLLFDGYDPHFKGANRRVSETFANRRCDYETAR
jgi:hypothetical protein